MNPAASNAPSIDPAALAEALAQLNDIQLPPGPSFWPLAPGYWALVIGFLIAVLASFLLRLWWRKTALRRAARGQLKQLKAEQQQLDDRAFLQALASLLRRAASALDSDSVALTGEPWVDYLNQRGKTNFFSTQAGQQLLEARFTKLPPLDRQRQLDAVEAWLGAAL